MSAGTPCADDGIGCTTDACDGAGACLHSPHDSLCAAAPCAIGRCDANAGCTDSPAPDGTGCDDGDDCTADDRCTAGQCTPGLRRCATVSSHPSGIAVDCVARGHRKGACSAQAFLASGSGVGEALSRVVRRRIGRRDGAHLVLKLSREGRRLLAALGGLVRVTVEIVVSRDGEGTILRRTIDLTAR